jgi:hypothetical protein
MRWDEFRRFTEIQPTVKNHPLINLEQKRITITQEIYKKRGTNQNRGRVYNNVHQTFIDWLNYFIDNDSILTCRKQKEHEVRSTVYTGTQLNLLRHTAITYHALLFKDTLQTAYIAGNSQEIISKHYLNMNLPVINCEKLYNLTPQKAKEEGIL